MAVATRHSDMVGIVTHAVGHDFFILTILNQNLRNDVTKTYFQDLVHWSRASPIDVIYG
jgi:hypothetical protein